MIGILAIQFPIDSINKVLTNNFDWQSQGLGASGECYLVGPDHTLRSRSRFMHEDPEGFVAEADAPIRRFGRTVVGVASGLALGSTLLALLFSHLLTRPLVRLADAARRLGAGQTDVAVPVATDDEFGQLGRVFNDMAVDIRRRKEQLEQ